MKHSIIVFRHGEVFSDGDKIFCGWLNLPLTKKGESQSKKLALKIAKEKIDYGFCSDLLRSKQALLEVLSFHPKAKVIVSHRLRERNYGVLTGYNKTKFSKKFPGFFNHVHRGYTAIIPKGEDIHDVAKRVIPFMNDLITFMQHEKCDVAISAHTNSMRVIIAYLENKPISDSVRLNHDPESYKKYVVEFD